MADKIDELAEVINAVVDLQARLTKAMVVLISRLDPNDQAEVLAAQNLTAVQEPQSLRSLRDRVQSITALLSAPQDQRTK